MKRSAIPAACWVAVCEKCGVRGASGSEEEAANWVCEARHKVVAIEYVRCSFFEAPLRRGLLGEVRVVFDAAVDMVGGTVHPDHMDEERERIARLQDEVLTLLRLRRKP